jgi:DNA-directed RNA polymerase subunit RPC12/RpoP
MNHYSKEELDRYLHKDVNFITKQKIKKHLFKCTECSKAFDELKEDDTLFDEIRSTYCEEISNTSIEQQTYTNLSTILGNPQKDSSVA